MDDKQYEKMSDVDMKKDEEMSHAEASQREAGIKKAFDVAYDLDDPVGLISRLAIILRHYLTRWRRR